MYVSLAFSSTPYMVLSGNYYLESHNAINHFLTIHSILIRLFYIIGHNSLYF
jgi:hypothetical protein